MILLFAILIVVSILSTKISATQIDAINDQLNLCAPDPSGEGATPRTQA